jgi:uncharacterized membrane protein
MGKSQESVSMPKNTAAALCYLLGWVTGLVFLLVEKKDKFIRFHAMQSVVTFGILTIASLAPLVGWILSPFIMIIGFVLWLVLMVKAYQGEEFELPVVGQLARQWLGKI